MPRGGPRVTTPEGFKNVVGERVRERRLDLGLTQTALAGRLAYHTDGRWNPSENELYKLQARDRIVSDVELSLLSLALECSLIYLLTGEGPPPLPKTPLVYPPDTPRPRRRSRKNSQDSHIAPNPETP